MRAELSNGPSSPRSEWSTVRVVYFTGRIVHGPSCPRAELSTVRVVHCPSGPRAELSILRAELSTVRVVPSPGRMGKNNYSLIFISSVPLLYGQNWVILGF
jgi:hypothetical protein